MRALAGCLLICTACGGDGGDTRQVDASSDHDDGPRPASGLTVTWATAPQLPGQVSDALVVTSAKVRVKRLEVIGDAGPGDTTRRDVQLVWSESAQPLPITFAFASPGIYSKVTLDIDGDLEGASYEILGLIDDGVGMAPFQIRDRGALAIDIDGYELRLAAGAHAQVPIRIELGEVFADLTVEQFHDEGGVWMLDDADPYINELRDALARAFRRGG